MSELDMEHGWTVIWSSDLNKFFNEITGLNWHYADGMDYPAQNTMNKTVIPDMEYSADSDGDEDWDCGFSWDKYFAGEGFFTDPYYEDSMTHPSPDHVLQWLYEHGHIPAGKYILEVWW